MFKSHHTKRKVVSLMLILLCICACVIIFIRSGFGKSSSTSSSNSSKKSIKSVDDLPGSVIGVQIGTTGDIYVSDYEGDEEGTVIDRFNKGPDAVAALTHGKVDCVVIDEQPAKAYIAQSGGLRILDEKFTYEEYAGVVAKDNTELLNNINSAIAELEEDGTIDKLKATYIDETSDYHYTQTVTSGDHLVLATNATFPPYEYYEDGNIVGFDIELGYAIADKLGMVLEIQDMEFDAIISAVNSGKSDVGFSGFTITEERKKSINFTSSYTTSSQVIIVKDSNAADSKRTLSDRFHDNFIKDSRWKYLTKGLLNTIIITVFALCIGLLLGFLLAIIRVSHDLNGSCKFLNILARLYITIIRGTPAMVQLLIIYYVIFASININKLIVAIIAFGLNSAAYVSEVIRSGIMSIDRGQFEAGTSLGLKFSTVMTSVILPQALKNVLPALGNEFISLLKETSISGYVGLMDLTKGGDIIRSVTYEALLPLLVVAAIYLIMVVGLSAIISKLERRLKKNER